MPLNDDFQKILNSFTKRYGSEKGKTLFYSWVNKHDLDETKPMPSHISVPSEKEMKENRFSCIRGIEVKAKGDDSFVIEGIIATTHIDSVNDRLTKDVLEKWAKEINEGNPRTNKVSYHHDRNDPKVVGIGMKGSAKVISLPDGHYGLYVKSEINKTHDLYDDIVYEVEHKMIDSHSIEFAASENPIFEQIKGTQVRILDENTDLYGWTLASRPINEHAVLLKEVMGMMDGNQHMMTEDEMKKKKKMMDMEKEKPKLGSGERFEALVQKVLGRKNPRTGKPYTREEAEKIAASAGREKYGKKKFQKLAASGKEGILTVMAEEVDMVDIMDISDAELNQFMEGNTMTEAQTVSAKEEPVTSSQIDMKEVVGKVLNSVEFKEALNNVKIENKVLINKEAGNVPVELKEYKHILSHKEKYSVDEQFLRAGKLADKIGLVNKFLIQKESGKSAEARKGALEFKNFMTNGRRLEFKNLGIDTNDNTDTDYLLSAAELADVFDPVVYNALNEKTVFWSILAKDDYSQKGNNQVQFTLKTAANTTAAFYSGNSVTTGNTTRQKFMTRFKKAQVGVAVDGDMIASARGGPIGDIFAQEVRDATETLLSVMNVQLFAATGAETADVPIGMSYITDSATNTTLYNVTRSAANRLSPDAAGDTYINGSSANVTLAQLRQAIRQCVTDGSRKEDLIFVCDPIQEDKIKLLFDDLARYNGPKETRFGFETQLFVDGVPVFVDKDCGNGSVYCVDMSAHRVAIWIPPTLEMLGKRSDSEEGFIKTYYAVYNRAPRRLVEIYSLATT